MKKTLISAFFTFITVFTLYSQHYTQDILGGNFLRHTIELSDDYEGEVIATLVKYNDTLRVSSQKAILYLHGFNDYFFQSELAEDISKNGIDFYALDLRKYGRSLLSHQKRYNAREMSEYFEDIDAAIDIIKGEGHDSIYLMGHSTGCLTATLYTHDHDKGKNINGLILNSPFFQQNQGWFNQYIGIPLVSLISYAFPNVEFEQAYSTAYTQSLHKKYSKEWDYDLELKLESSPAVTYSWLRAIYNGQNRIKEIKNMPIPVVVMHSDKSTSDTKYSSNYDNSDAVLDVADMDKHARNMGKNVEVIVIKNALHDIALSRKDVREKYYQEIHNFLIKH
ncbi:MAG: alpha/beta hydrolase [Rikenellaceae bacterium]